MQTIYLLIEMYGKAVRMILSNILLNIPRYTGKVVTTHLSKGHV